VNDFVNIDPRFAEAEIRASELRRKWNAEQWELWKRQIASSAPTLGSPSWSIFRPTSEWRS
jgi:hypothetical protein